MVWWWIKISREVGGGDVVEMLCVEERDVAGKSADVDVGVLESEMKMIKWKRWNDQMKRMKWSDGMISEKVVNGDETTYL